MSDGEVLFDRHGCAGVITLNRPAALNALTLGMVRAIHPQLEAWSQSGEIARVVIKASGDKAFCAGGDIRALYDWGRAQDRTFLDFYGEEYQLNSFIKRFPKPYLALLDGITMGGGVGVSVHGSHRVATERMTFAMPETGIGLFPDVGGTYFLPRCPGELGMYLGLTGHRLKAADAVYTGVATHFVTTEHLGGLEAALRSDIDVETILADLTSDPGEPPLAAHRAAIDAHFAHDSVEAIIDSLEGAGDVWAARTADILRAKSPTSLKITHRQIRTGAGLDFEDCMRLEYRIVNGIFRGHDFFEGTRAVVIDKDQMPGWQPATLSEVSEAMIDAYFAELDEELELPPQR